MDAIRRLQLRYGGGALSAAAAMGIAAHMAGHPAIAWGLVLGSLFSALNFLLLGNALSSKLLMDGRSGALRTVAGRAGRYLLWAVPVVLAVRLPSVDLPAAIAGVFMVPLLIVLDTAINLARGGKSPPV